MKNIFKNWKLKIENSRHSRAGFTRQNFSKKNLGGFTLVELLIVTAIIVIMSGAMVVDYRQGLRKQNINNGTAELISLLEKAKSAALSGNQYNNSPVPEFNVYFDTTENTYLFCANSQSCVNNLIQNVKFPQEVYLDKIIWTDGSTSNDLSKVTVDFSSPYGDIYFNSDLFTNRSSGNVQLYLKNYTGDERKIIIDAVSGRVSAD